jgi:hypothetical protein
VQRKNSSMTSTYLLAYGFNGHNQLAITNGEPVTIQQINLTSAVSLKSFRAISCIRSVPYPEELEVNVVGWSYTIISHLSPQISTENTDYYYFGQQPNDSPIPETLNLPQKTSFIGTNISPVGFLTPIHKLSWLNKPDSVPNLTSILNHKPGLSLTHISILENGKVTASTTSELITFEYPPPTTTALNSSTVTSQPNVICKASPAPIAHLTGGAMTHALLSTTGKIYTWGDPRHGEYLGRPVDVTPADEPGLVTISEHSLDKDADATETETRFAKVLANGTLFGALTEDGALYVWGETRPLGRHREEVQRYFGQNEQPERIAVPGRVVDFGITWSGIVCLVDGAEDDAELGIYVWGENIYGELMLHASETEVVKEMMRVGSVGKGLGARVVCGPVTTFLLFTV